MTRMSRMGGAVAAAVVLFSLFAASAAARDGYVDVRVAGDNAACGAVVLRWSLDQPRRDYIPLPIPVPEDDAPAPAAVASCDEPAYVEPIVIEPVTELAETTPVPIIHHHPALNAGMLFFPPADGDYRHYFSEEAPSPFTWHADKGQYEAYLGHTFPYFDPRANPPGVVETVVVVPVLQGVVFQPIAEIPEGALVGGKAAPADAPAGCGSCR